MPDQIILYDIPSKVPWKAWSPNTWKIRFSLTYKGLPFRTEWVEYPDIAAVAEKVGSIPVIMKSGTPTYTVPFIHDQSTGEVVSDSMKIALYLEATYPNTPRLFPAPVPLARDWLLGIHVASEDAIDHVLPGVFWDFVAGSACFILNPSSEEFYRTTRERAYGKKIEDLIPPPSTPERLKLQEEIKKGLNKINRWYKHSLDSEGGLWIGNSVSYTDFQWGGHLMWIKSAIGDDSDEWKIFLTHNDGRWGKLVEALGRYTNLN